jgi:hypothetical protein
MLTPEQIDLAIQQHVDPVATYGRLHNFARAIEAEARRDALEEAAQLVEKATYRTRWVKAGVNGQASNTPPCALAAAIRKLKEDTQ